MSDETNKKSEIKEVAIESELLNNCLERFLRLEEKVEAAQMGSVQGKYQYFLRKYQTITEEHQKYKDIYENLSKIVDESPQIQDENSSIEFINKVMEETQMKYNKLKRSIIALKTQKQTNQCELVRLKNILMKKKGEYFELQRQEEEIEEKRKAEENGVKKKEQLHRMFKIRQDKRGQAKDSSIIQPSYLNLNSSFAERRVMDQLQAINKMKEQFLCRVGTNINQYYKNQERQLDLQERANKLINKRKVYLKDRSNFRSMGNYEPEANALEVFRIMETHDRELEEFMKLSAQEVLEQVVRKDKIQEVLRMMEEEKRDLVQSYQKVKYLKLKSN